MNFTIPKKVETKLTSLLTALFSYFHSICIMFSKTTFLPWLFILFSSLLFFLIL